MSTVVAAGLLVGAAVWLAWTGLHPAPEPLSAALARIDRRPPDVGSSSPDGTVDWDDRVGRLLLRRVPALARAVERVHTDLRLVGRSPEEQAARVGALVGLALVLGPWVGFMAWVVGLDLPAFVPGAITLGGIAWGVVTPFTGLRREAVVRRQAFCHALSAFCDVSVMTLAAGRGVEQAMETAVAGHGWAFAELRGALRAGHVRGDPPWLALERLGVDLGIPDLAELGSTIAMAGEEGAAIRTTVTAKARSIRERMTSETELAAAAVTERMGLPTVLLVLGFLVFLGYPALHVILGVGA